DLYATDRHATEAHLGVAVERHAPAGVVARLRPPRAHHHAPRALAGAVGASGKLDQVHVHGLLTGPGGDLLNGHRHRSAEHVLRVQLVTVRRDAVCQVHLDHHFQVLGQSFGGWQVDHGVFVHGDHEAGVVLEGADGLHDRVLPALVCVDSFGPHGQAAVEADVVDP